MKHFRSCVLPLLFAAIAVNSNPISAQEITSELDASLRFGIGLDTEPDAEFSFNDYASRIRWSGRADLGDNKAALGYLEFGIGQNSGVRSTRQAWVGYESEVGTITGGKQYSALYDAVVSRVDIAWWGSCFYEYACGRDGSVIKYKGNSNDDLTIHASTRLVDEESTDDGAIIDEVEAGATLEVGDGLNVGLGLGYVFDNQRSEAGFSLMAGATQVLDELTLSGLVQFVDGDVIGASDDSIGLTLSAQQGNYYGIIGLQNNDNTPFYITAGYSRPVIGDHARFYIEAQIDEPDLPGSDAELLGRAVFVFDFDVLSTQRTL